MNFPPKIFIQPFPPRTWKSFNLSHKKSQKPLFPGTPQGDGGGERGETSPCPDTLPGAGVHSPESPKPRFTPPGFFFKVSPNPYPFLNNLWKKGGLLRSHKTLPQTLKPFWGFGWRGRFLKPTSLKFRLKIFPKQFPPKFPNCLGHQKTGVWGGPIGFFILKKNKNF